MAATDDENVRLAIVEADLGLPFVEPVPDPEITRMGFRCIFRSRVADFVKVESRRNRPGDGRNVRLIYQPDGSDAGPIDRVKANDRFDDLTAGQYPRRGRSAAVFTRNSVARTSEARWLSSLQRFSFPLDVASARKSEKIPQWLSGRKSLARTLLSVASARPKARTIAWRLLRPKAPAFPTSMRFPDLSVPFLCTHHTTTRNQLKVWAGADCATGAQPPSSVRQAADEIDDRGADLAGRSAGSSGRSRGASVCRAVRARSV